MCLSAVIAESAVSIFNPSIRSCRVSGSACKRAGSSSTIRMCIGLIEDFPLCSFGVRKRELNEKGCSLARAVLHPDVTLVFLYNTIGDRESQACPCPHFFGGEEGIEDAFFQSHRNPGASVAEDEVELPSLHG